MIRLAAVILGAGLLASCGGPDAGSNSGQVSEQGEQADVALMADPIVPGPDDIARAADMVPVDAGVAAKYDRSCRSCHSMPDAGAPMTGHQAEWDRRFAQTDAQALLASTKQGLNAMPAMGLCNDCSDEDFTALIQFMAGR